MIFDENLFVGYFIALVSSDRCSVSDLILTSSFPIFFNDLCCCSIKSFNYSCYFSDRENMASNILSDR